MILITYHSPAWTRLWSPLRPGKGPASRSILASARHVGLVDFALVKGGGYHSPVVAVHDRTRAHGRVAEWAVETGLRTAATGTCVARQRGGGVEWHHGPQYRYSLTPNTMKACLFYYSLPSKWMQKSQRIWCLLVFTKLYWVYSSLVIRCTQNSVSNAGLLFIFLSQEQAIGHSILF